MSTQGIGVSALLAFQRAISVTGHNIANSATEGYSRQRTEMNTLSPHFLGGSYLGQGVGVDSIRRITDEFVNTQLRTSLSEQAHAMARAGLAGRVDQLLADDSSGLAPVLQGFFDAASDVANDPTSNAARTVFLAEAESLAERFGSIQARLQEQREILNGQIHSSVDEINQLARSLADLNREIINKSTRGTPNDLLDQRDRVLNQLAEKIDVTTVEQGDGALNVFVGNGQPMVLGMTSRELVADSLSGDPDTLEVGIRSGDSVSDISRFLQGGELGGLLEIRGSVLDRAQNQLGQIAAQIGQAFNEQNAQGLDANGVLGGDIFQIGQPATWGFGGNVSSERPTVAIDNADALSLSDYHLRVNDDGDFQLVRLSDQQVVDTLDPNTGTILEADGLQIDISDLGDAEPDDRWLIQPTRYGARDLEVVLGSPSGIAAAAAMPQVVADAGNTGTAVIEGIEITGDFDPATLPLDISVTEVGGDLFYEVAGTPFPVDPNGPTMIEHGGWTLTLNGEPAPGDEWVVDLDPDHPGDNRNMLAMAALSDTRTVEVDGETRRLPGFGGAYSSLLADVGMRARQANTALESTAVQLQQAQAQRESISGVNLDEEAADLMRYQHAYQAAAHVIQVSNSLFDSLLGAFRR